MNSEVTHQRTKSTITGNCNEIRMLLDRTTFSEASSRRTGGSSIGNTIENKINISKHRRKYKTNRKKNNQSQRNIKLMSFRGYSKQ